MLIRSRVSIRPPVSRCNFICCVSSGHAIVACRLAYGMAYILLRKTTQEVLKSVRSADKFCMDIMCILLLLGMIAVLYGVIQNT